MVPTTPRTAAAAAAAAKTARATEFTTARLKEAVCEMGATVHTIPRTAMEMADTATMASIDMTVADR